MADFWAENWLRNKALLREEMEDGMTQLIFSTKINSTYLNFGSHQKRLVWRSLLSQSWKSVICPLGISKR